MSAPHDTLVWLDADQARLIHFSTERMERHGLRVPTAGDELHRAIADRIGQAGRVLVLGSEDALRAFRDFLAERHPLVHEKVIAWETADHPNDTQLAAAAARLLVRSPTEKKGKSKS